MNNEKFQMPKSILQRLKNRLREEAFITSYISVIINPAHIIRNGLYKHIKAHAPNIEGKILDVGCGSKPYESLFLKSSSYTGVDIEVSGHSHTNSKIDFFYDGKTLPFEDSSFDAVVSFEVFEHVFNLDEVLKEIRRVLKPGGKLLVTMPFAWDEHEVPYDFARYTSYGITHILKSNDFNVDKVEKTTTYFLAVSQMLIAYLCQYVTPKGRYMGRLSQLLIIFPITLLAILLNKILPQRYEYFCNTLVLAQKSSKPTPPPP